ncbi:hypothetical protein V8E53_005486 [Lactarius tabidus]
MQSGILHFFSIVVMVPAILIMLTAFSALAFYFILLHLRVYLVTIMKATSILDGVNEIYRVLATENNPVYAGLVDERPEVDISEGRQDATAWPPRLEDDAASVLSELTQTSEPRAARDNEHSDEESEAEVPLAEIHRLKKRNSSGESLSHTQTHPTAPVSLVPHTAFQTLGGVDVYAQKVRATKDATYNVFESVGEAEVVTPPFLPKYLVIPLDLYIHRWSGGVQIHTQCTLTDDFSFVVLSRLGG